MRWIAVLLACFALASCKNDVSKPVQKVAKVANSSQQPEAFAMQAYDTFVAACPALASSDADLSEWKFSASALSRIERDLGWSRAFDLSFRVADRPVAASLNSVAGHVCTFTLGGGAQPGYFAERDHCAKVCGIAAHSQLASVPGMNFLDELDSPGYKARRQGLESEFNERVAGEEPRALQNDYQAQRNLAAIYSNESFEKEDRIRGCAWRMVIVSNHSFAAPSDTANLADDCAALTPHEKDAAAKLAATLAEELPAK